MRCDTGRLFGAQIVRGARHRLGPPTGHHREADRHFSIARLEVFDLLNIFDRSIDRSIERLDRSITVEKVFERILVEHPVWTSSLKKV